MSDATRQNLAEVIAAAATQREIDKRPCPACGGDPLRPAFDGRTDCHAPWPEDDPSNTPTCITAQDQGDNHDLPSVLRDRPDRDRTPGRCGGGGMILAGEAVKAADRAQELLTHAASVVLEGLGERDETVAEEIGARALRCLLERFDLVDREEES